MQTSACSSVCRTTCGRRMKAKRVPGRIAVWALSGPIVSRTAAPLAAKLAAPVPAGTLAGWQKRPPGLSVTWDASARSVVPVRGSSACASVRHSTIATTAMPSAAATCVQRRGVKGAGRNLRALPSAAQMATDGPALEQAAAVDLLDTSAAGPAAIRGSVLRVSAYAAGVLLSVGSASLLVRHLGVVDFGHYATVMSLITVCAGVTDLGITAIGVRDYSTRTGPERDRVLRNLLGVRLAAPSAGVAGATLFALAAGYERTLVIGTVLAGIGMTVQATQAFYATSLLAQLRLGAVSA